MATLPDEFWEGEEEELVKLLMRHLYNAAVTSGQLALAELGDAVSVDWELVNEPVRNWARSMSLDLVKGITETSRTFTTDAIAKWIESGQELGKLSEALEPMFGPVRGQMVAETEVTRAFAEGNRAAWRLSGVVDGRTWYTAMDEIVAECPICAPMHGATAPLSQPFVHPDTGEEYDDPPAHPRCRCWTIPVVNI